VNDNLKRHFSFALQARAAQAEPPAAALQHYAPARRLAEQNLALRLIYSAMQEGIISASLHVGSPDGDVTLHNPREIYDYLYTRNDQQEVQLTLSLQQQDYPIGDIGHFLNGVLRESVISKVPEASQNANWLQFQYEIMDSLNHEALAMTAKRHFQQSLTEEMQGQDNLFEWLKTDRAQKWLTANNHDIDSFLLQMGSFNGHPTHPSSKMRLRLDPERKGKRHPVEADEAQKIFPEFAPDVPLQLYALRADRSTSTTSSRDFPAGYRDYMRQSFPDAFGKWEQALDAKLGKGAAEAYVPMPVHPLQTEELAHRFAQQISAGVIVPLPEVTVIQRPTVSTRTLSPVNREAEPQIKTVMNMQMTSVVRTIAPARAYNSPIYSDLVRDLVEQDDSIRPYIRPLMEQAAAYYGTESGGHSQDYQDGFQLCAVFKQNPAQLTKPGEIRMPVAAMLRDSPFSGKPVLIDIMRAAGIDSAQKATRFLRDYVDIVVRSEVGLLARYGVGLEGHQQNNDMVFDAATAQPKATVYRDINGGIEASEPMLKMHGYDIAPHMHPVKKGLYDSIDLPLQQTMHTTFHSHLFPLVALISKVYDLPQQALYSQIRESVTQTLDAAHQQHMPAMLEKLPEPERPKAQQQFEKSLGTIRENLLSRDLETKCLLQMRLGQTQGMKFSRSPNPLQIG
jgi:siderophore synthetase component